MKKLTLIATLLALLTLFVACGSDTDKKVSEKATGEKKVTVVATIYPQYAWLKEILGNRADSLGLTLLIKNGMDLHSYKPSAADIATIAQAAKNNSFFMTISASASHGFQRAALPEWDPWGPREQELPPLSSSGSSAC